jgi:hypothetical protein
MKQIKFRQRTECVLPTLYVGMYAFRPNTELVPVFQSAGNLVPIGIPAESDRNVPPRFFLEVKSGQKNADCVRMSKILCMHCLLAFKREVGDVY